jgi:excisionase family DNA binding protein
MSGNGNDSPINGRWSGKKIFTTGEAATICKVSQQTIIRCFDSGRLNGFRVPGSKFRRIPREELLRFMRDNNIPTDALEGSTRRVLVVDDDPEILRLFEDFLGEDVRFELETAMTGYDAGMLTESFKPHLIVLDYMLPDINGTAVCKRIRANEHTKDAKIIFVSGVVDPSEVDQLMEAGADEFVKKPFSIQQLHLRMLDLLGMRENDATVQP